MKKLIRLLLLVMFISACAKKGNLFPSENCIPPVTTFAYSSNSVIPSHSEQIDRTRSTPSSQWEKIIAIPLFPEDALPKTTYARLLLAHSSNAYTEIWIKRYWQVNGSTPNGRVSKEDLMVYRTDKKEWGSVDGKIDMSKVLVGDLFLSSDGSIWSHNYFVEGYPQFSIYDQSSGKFHFNANANGIPFGKVAFSQNDIFWIVPYNDYIYSFNLRTEEMQQHVATPNIFAQSVDIAPNGNIFILDTGGKQVISTDDEQLLQFNPANNQIEKVAINLDTYPPVWSILFDRSGNLWLDDRGWMTSDGVWYQVVRSPVFLSRGSNHKWLTPQLEMESSDRVIWFSSSNGLTSLNSLTGSWCWITTAQDADIIEDQHKNLWLIADNELYKLALNP